MSQKLKQSDFVYMWWANGIRDRSDARRFNMLSGNYGLSVDPKRLNITRFGAVHPTYRAAGAPDNRIIDALPAVSSRLGVTVDGVRYEATEAPDGVAPYRETQPQDYRGYICRELGVEHDDFSKMAYRQIEGGRLVQRFDIYDFPFTDGKEAPALRGHLEFVALPEHVSLVYHLFPEKAQTAVMDLTLRLEERFACVERSDRALTMRASDGSGYTFVLPMTPSGVPKAEVDGSTVRFSLTVSLEAPDPEAATLTERMPYWKRKALNILVVPSERASLADAAPLLGYEAVQGTACQFNSGDRIEYDAPCRYNSERGIFEIQADEFRTHCASDEHMNDLENVRFTLVNPTDTPVRLPVAVTDHDNNCQKADIGGQMCFAPMLCEPDGTPTGCYVQNSMNWHSEFRDLGSLLYDKPWKRMTTIIELPPHGKAEYLFRVAYQKYGGVTKASHSQLSVIGWGANQDWEVLAFGGIFENTCYEPEGIQRYDGAMIDDCRPLYGLMGNGSKWNATESSGGGNFLVYEKDGVRQYQTTVKTAYVKAGPLSTKTVHRYVTADGAIRAEVTVGANATDDVVRVRHCMRYEVLRDTEFSRLAFYQLGSDGYNDHSATAFAFGNESGATFVKEVSYPLEADERHYLPGCTGIELTGDVPWVAFSDEHLTRRNDTKVIPHYGDRMVTVRKWKAVLGGEPVEYPYVSAYNTLAEGLISGVGLEIAPPPTLRALKEGDAVELELEYVILLHHRSDYYGPEQELMDRVFGLKENGLYDGNGEGTWRPAYFAAMSNDVSVLVSRGRLLHENPVRIQCEDDAAEFTVCGGMGYLGVTMVGLSGVRGYALYEYRDGAWAKQDRSVHGNDFWQADVNVVTGEYELTYVVRRNADGAVTRYRFGKE
ncbi:MAG: hypothetical protein KIG36_06900 [Eubacteriales bacterium]|nr:hypothetical protein [Eubacteriales bacterium]